MQPEQRIQREETRTIRPHPTGSGKRSTRFANSHGPCFMQQFIYMHSFHCVSPRFLHAEPGTAAAPGRAACLLLNDGREWFSGVLVARETARAVGIRPSSANTSARRFSLDVKNGNLISILGEPIDRYVAARVMEKSTEYPRKRGELKRVYPLAALAGNVINFRPCYREIRQRANVSHVTHAGHIPVTQRREILDVDTCLPDTWSLFKWRVRSICIW